MVGPLSLKQSNARSTRASPANSKWIPATECPMTDKKFLFRCECKKVISAAVLDSKNDNKPTWDFSSHKPVEFWSF